mmetsp:Transcript_38477/g.77587  ORF Transcript_38477/g.77587 Transcript_38477/m.77587 type:complete len:210 (-) Transcript_38477:24-653(-)
MPDTFSPSSELFTAEAKGGDTEGGVKHVSSKDALLPSVDCAWFDCEENPFTRTPFFNEVVFFHKPSKTLFCADTWWNYPESGTPNFSLHKSPLNSKRGVGEAIDGGAGKELKTGEVHQCSKVPVPETVFPAVSVPLGTRLWKFGMDRVYLPFYKRFMVGGRSSLRRVRYEERVQQILDWEPEVMVPCHGDVLRGKEQCRQEIERHFLGN